MHARVVTSEIQQGRIDEYISIYRDIVSGVSQKGFRGALLLTDRSADRSISVTLWETEADMLATETSGWWQEQADKFDPVTEGEHFKEHYEVSVQVQESVETFRR